MFIISILLFLLGIFACGMAFSVEGYEALIFTGGILLVTIAIALPVHLRKR